MPFFSSAIYFFIAFSSNINVFNYCCKMQNAITIVSTYFQNLRYGASPESVPFVLQLMICWVHYSIMQKKSTAEVISCTFIISELFIKQFAECILVLFKHFEQMFVPVPCICGAAAEHIVLLTVVYNIKSGDCFCSACSSVRSCVCE